MEEEEPLLPLTAPDKKLFFTIEASPSLVCVAALYSCDKNWKTYVSSRKFLGSI